MTLPSSLFQDDRVVIAPITILIIEDSLEDVEFIQHILDQLTDDNEYRLEHTELLDEGLERLARGGVDVILLDLVLPDSRGFVTFTTVQEHAPLVPIIVMTGLSDERLAIKALHGGAQDYLYKGKVDPGVFVRAIRYSIERKRAVSALRESEERLRSITDNTTAVIFMKDTVGRYLQINRQHEMLFHISNEEIKGKTDYDVFPEEVADTLIANDRKVLEAGTALEFEEIVNHDDGPHTYISTRFPLLNTEGRAYAICGIATDITRRIRMEEDLRNLQNDLVQAGKLAALGQMAANITHELNQPLEATQAYVDNLALLLKEERYDEIRSNLIAISDLTRHAGKITSNIKTFIHKTEASKIPVSLGAALENVLSFLVFRIKKDGAHISKFFPKDDIQVLGDPVQLGQVFLNILSNSLDAMQDSSSARLFIQMKETSGSVLLTFKDNGPGVPEDIIDRVFDPFFSTKNGNKGLGLGLSISKSIIEGFGGTLKVSNHEEGGAMFTLEFPRIESNHER